MTAFRAMSGDQFDRAVSQPQTRTLAELLRLGLDSESFGISDEESELLYRHESREYLRGRLQRNGYRLNQHL